MHRLLEKDPWAKICAPGGKYYLTRNASTILAFAIGKNWKVCYWNSPAVDSDAKSVSHIQPGNPIAMIGAHTDSCTLRVKPVSKKQSDGFIQVGVETYGGGLWHTWFDRDLSIAGRAFVKAGDGSYTQKLVKIDRPILRIPTLAIHLDRQEKFEFNKETQLFPIAGLVAAELNRRGQSDHTPSSSTTEEEADYAPLKATTERHHPYMVELIAKEAKVDPSEVVDFEMVLYDTQKACVGGLNEELMFSPRLDNLEMSYCSTMGLINSVHSPSSLDCETAIRLISLFDHEEIGSETAQGADSNFLPTMVRRLSALSLKGSGEPDADAYEQTLSKSFLVSADMAHSVNPNYASKYESDHKPEMNKGTVIKINANARYATNSPGIVLIEEAARRARVPLQLFVVRNDSSCGSTIGPMLSSSLGTRTLDLGNPQLSMHSIRETGGVYDVEYAIKLFESFFEHYSELEKKFVVD
ncbi:hypothetical protein OEA41_001656 [Lepraria neglecta]|uniref:aspartyl aminopeptidase n=1 Tax=Lepraria neglecta TaxID=209136 RepID=A0AAD9ZAH5_9LECA|nr:hypothetical protein OEA41_001656 [Lepraria neglecta]